MFILYKKQLLMISALISLAACSRGGINVKTTPYCASNYDRLTLNPDEIKSKIEIKDGAPFAPPVRDYAGDYAYDGSQIFYHDWVRNITIHLQDAKDGSGQFALSTVCIGGDGVNPKMMPVTINVDIVSDLRIDPDGRQFVRKKNYDIYLGRPRKSGDLWLIPQLNSVTSEYGEGTPQDTYANNTKIKSATQYFITLKTAGDAVPTQFKLAAFLDDPFSDKTTPDKNHPEMTRVVVNMKTVSSDQRKKIDDDNKKRADKKKKDPGSH